MKFKYITAPVYSGLLSPAILQMDIQETKATCDNCLMARSPTPLKDRYEGHLKCCTFYPFVPNFAVGAILKDSTGRYAHAQGVLRKHIQKGQYSVPIGVVAPLKYQLAFKTRSSKGFGRIEEELCPYYHKESQGCSMWAYRGAVCTSFYCKSSWGAKGKVFWSRVSDYLTYVEVALMEEALIRLDFSPRQISECLVYLNRDPKDPGPGSTTEMKGLVLPKKIRQKLWRDYITDQEGFFIKCYEIVSGFDRSDFKEMMGRQGAELEEKVLKTHEFLKKA